MSQQKRQPDWTQALNLRAALVQLHYEMQGDWYRDPWGWPELGWIVGRGQDVALARLNSSGVWLVAKIDVPKENFGIRPAIVMDPVDRLIHQALVDRVSAQLIGDLNDWVYGWRLQQGQTTAGVWSHNDRQHEGFRNALKLAADANTAALRTDIISYFASVDLGRLCEMIETRAGSSQLTERLMDLVRGWGQVVGRNGLAQRSGASAALANMYLREVDDVLSTYSRHGHARRRTRNSLLLPGDFPRVARWMDDIWLFGHDAGRLRAAQLELQEVLRSAGLEMNLGKTALLEGEDLDREVREVQHSAIDRALSVEPPDSAPLVALVEEILDHPATSDRTTIRFATVRLRNERIYEPVPGFVEKAREMPHGSDSLARLFRDSKYWRELPEWYVKYAESPWGAVRWSIAQLGTAFPSKLTARSSVAGMGLVQEYFFKLLESDQPLPLLALAAQRLAAWDAAEARPVFRAAATRSDDPQARRVLALAATTARDDRSNIRDMLSEFEENRVTLKMLEDRSFRVTVKDDFAA